MATDPVTGKPVLKYPGETPEQKLARETDEAKAVTARQAELDKIAPGTAMGPNATPVVEPVAAEEPAAEEAKPWEAPTEEAEAEPTADDHEPSKKKRRRY